MNDEQFYKNVIEDYTKIKKIEEGQLKAYQEKMDRYLKTPATKWLPGYPDMTLEDRERARKNSIESEKTAIKNMETEIEKADQIIQFAKQKMEELE